MTAQAQDFWQEQEDDPIVRIDGRIDPGAHDTYWQSVYWSQPYFRSMLDYEDYAPAARPRRTGWPPRCQRP